MKKEQMEKELDFILKESNRLQEKVEMEFATAKFLQKEADKLMEVYETGEGSMDERERILHKMNSLQIRIQKEIKMWQDDMPELNNLGVRLELLQKQTIDDEE